jgi:TonB family protein
MSSLMIAIICCSMLGSQLQRAYISETQAVTSVQRVFVSRLDAGLPNRPFEDWFRQIVGPQAGVSWQLSECGEAPSILIAQGRDVPACIEVNALLPDNRKVVVMIEVGTLKKGLTGNLAFSHAAIEQAGELYRVRRLIDLPDGLRQPATLIDRNSIKLAILDSKKLQSAPGAIEGKLPDDLMSVMEAPPPPKPKPVVKPTPPPSQNTPKSVPPQMGALPAPALAPPSKSTSTSTSTLAPKTGPAPSPETLEVSEGVWRDNTITKVEPVYPPGARRSRLKGRVRVEIVVSLEGRVIEATAVSGPALLRQAAVEAALKWVFVPATLNGTPVQVASSLTFLFTPPN